MLCANVASTARYGRLDIDAAGRIHRFREKDPADSGPGSINAGLYLFSQRWLKGFARGTGPSLERDVFATAAAGTFNAIPAEGAVFVDIGTPESYAEAEAILTKALRRDASGVTRTPMTRSVA